MEPFSDNELAEDPATEAPANEDGADGEPAVDASVDDASVDGASVDDAPADDPATPLGDLPAVPAPEPVEPVRRRRGKDKERRRDAVKASSLGPPSLSPPLLSGRSLESNLPKRRFRLFADHPRIVTVTIVILTVVAALVVGKAFAERSADAAMSQRVDELQTLLAEATPEEFLAFNAGVQETGSLAERTRNEDGFVSVEATADRSFIRFQPSGWWAGFTERCLVAVVRSDGVTVTVPKRACIRVEAPPA